MSDKEVLFEVDGFKVKSGSYYLVKDKEDKSAPTGLQVLGLSKMPAHGVDEGFYCSGKEIGKRRDAYNPEREVVKMLYDTGFYPESPMYANVPKEEVKKRVMDLRNSIVIPYEKLFGKGYLDHNNYDFWEGTQFKLRSQQPLRTDNIEDLLTLYIALAHKRLMPSGSRKDGRYNKASYQIIDKAKDREVGEERDSVKIDTYYAFSSLLNKDKATLINALSYLGLEVDNTLTESSIKTTFKGWIEEEHGSLTNARRFLALSESFNKPHGKDVVNILPIIKKLVKSGSIERDEQGAYSFKGEALGNELKAVADNVCKNTELKHIKDALLLGE